MPVLYAEWLNLIIIRIIHEIHEITGANHRITILTSLYDKWKRTNFIDVISLPF